MKRLFADGDKTVGGIGHLPIAGTHFHQETHAEIPDFADQRHVAQGKFVIETISLYKITIPAFNGLHHFNNARAVHLSVAVQFDGTLTIREKEVLELRFGLFDGSSHTLEEVGKKFKVTRERIRQIEAKALRKLRHPSRAKKLKDFLIE